MDKIQYTNDFLSTMEFANIRRDALFQKKEKDGSVYQYEPVAPP